MTFVTVSKKTKKYIKNKFNLYIKIFKIPILNQNFAINYNRKEMSDNVTLSIAANHGPPSK
jgi:hypothetical protein